MSVDKAFIYLTMPASNALLTQSTQLRPRLVSAIMDSSSKITYVRLALLIQFGMEILVFAIQVLPL